MHTTHTKGLIGELEFSLYLTHCDYTVLKPIDSNSSYDLVIERNNRFTRLQIKYCTPKYGRLRIRLDRPKRKTKPYKEREVDAMGVFNSKNRKFYIIPLEFFENKTEIWLRVEDARNFQVKGINLASQFELLPKETNGE